MYNTPCKPFNNIFLCQHLNFAVDIKNLKHGLTLPVLNVLTKSHIILNVIQIQTFTPIL